MANAPPDGLQDAGSSSVSTLLIPTISTTFLTFTSIPPSLAAYAATQTSSSSPADPSDTSTIDASTTSNVPVQIANSFSLVACIGVFVTYFVFRRKYQRIMERPSLVLAVSMATSDGILHTINLFGYTSLPHNFICAFFGGFLYAFPTLTSIFYSSCIALNTQLVFVFSKRPGNSTLKYYIGVPVLISALICIPALAVGAYGYDASYDFCWYSWNGTEPGKVFIRYFFTFGFWCLIMMLYLVFAAATIIHAVFAKSSKINQLASNLTKTAGSGGSSGERRGNNSSSANRRSGLPAPPVPLSQLPSFLITKTDPSLEFTKDDFDTEPSTPMTPITPVSPRAVTKRPSAAPLFGSGGSSGPTSPKPRVTRRQSETLSRRTMAMRALALRLLGYILIPTICILPGVIQDVISKTAPDTAAKIPDRVTTMFDTLNGLVGFFNAILFIVDPALLTLYHLMKLRRKERKNAAAERMQMRYAHPSRPMPYEVADTRLGISANDGATTDFRTGLSVNDNRTGLSAYDGDTETREVASVYATALEAPVTLHPDAALTLPPEADIFDVREYPESNKKGRARIQFDNATGYETKVQVEKKKKKKRPPMLSPVFTRRPPPNSFMESWSSGGTGVVIRVDVEVEDDGDRDLDRLERYLGGL